jgi:hypothetical protein
MEDKVKCKINWASCHKNVMGSGDTAPPFLIFILLFLRNRPHSNHTNMLTTWSYQEFKLHVQVLDLTWPFTNVDNIPFTATYKTSKLTD